MNNRKDKEIKLKILAISDFHGKFPRLLKEDKDFDIIISPGDYCSTAKIREIKFRNWESEKEWYDIIGRRKARRLVLESVRGGERVVERLVSYGKPVFGIPGNSDFTGSDEEDWKTYQKNHYGEHTKHKNYKDIDMKRRLYKGFQLIGFGESSFPEKKGDPLLYDIWYGLLERIFKKRRKRIPVIFVSHNPPYGVLDKVGMKSSPMYGEHLGSEVARDIVKRFRPLLCISGHIHESQGRKKLGNTVVVNCGYANKGEYAVIEIGKKGREYDVKVKLRGKKGKKRKGRRKKKNRKKEERKSRKKEGRRRKK